MGKPLPLSLANYIKRSLHCSAAYSARCRHLVTDDEAPAAHMAAPSSDFTTRLRLTHQCKYALRLNKTEKLECGQMPNVMAAQPNIGVALCESSVIAFLVPRRKVWLTPAAGVPCSNAANIGERETWTQSDFCMCQNSVRGQKPPKLYI